MATLLIAPLVAVPLATAYTSGDELAIFGHTFDEEYWTNNSILVETAGGNASLTASYVNVGEFSAFLIAFNEIVKDNQEIILPYQLFGMHFKTPSNTEVFIGAILAFLMVHNETYGDNNLPDLGTDKDDAWYLIPVSGNASPWADVTPSVEAIEAEKLGDNHYRFGMRYYNMSARVVSASGGFLLSLILPILTALISEIEIVYDIQIDESGVVHAETLYTIGQITRTRWWGFIDQDPSEIIVDTMKISIVHYLVNLESNWSVANSTSGNTILPPTQITPLNDNLSITVGNDERAFDIGLGRNYALINETSDTTIGHWDALNTLLATRASDFLMIAWQAPLSAWIFAHMAYGLSTQVQNTYSSVQELVNNAPTAFHGSTWWYAVTFPEWHGLRVQQDPVYVAYTNLEAGDTPSGDSIFGLILIVGVIAVIVVLIRRRR